MDRILFKFGGDIQPITRFGEIDLLSRPCFFRGKELGYKNIFFEWPLNIDYELNYSETILPIKFVNYYDVIPEDYDRLLYLSDRDVFYDCSTPLFNPLNPIKRDHYSFLNYLNKYYIEQMERPIYNIKKDNLKDKYILIHIRNSKRSISRNPSMENYRYIIKLLQEKCSDYKLYGLGDDSCLNEEFDKFFGKSSNFNDFLRLMNNSSLFIGCSSGPIQYAYSFGIPIIELDIPKSVDWGDPKGPCGPSRYKGLGNYYTEKMWKYGLYGVYGETVDHYIDKRTYLKLFKGDKINPKVIHNFLDDVL